MKNKELMKRLAEYFLTQDPEVVAKLLAGYMIDLYRVARMDFIPQKEQERLLLRMELNSKELQRFAKGGPQGPLKYQNTGDDE